MPDHSSRKADHLDLCATDQVAYRRTTLLEQVQIVHDSLPDLAVDEIDLSTQVVGRVLRAPLVISAMTGGLDRAQRINEDLAAVAQSKGIAMGFGSMRPLLEEGVEAGYMVRHVAPDAVLFGNIGVVQARDTESARIADMLQRTDCDALCVHLNPAQEVVQPGGDTDFRGGLDTIARLVADLPVPVIVKETGNGMSRSLGQRLAGVGVRWVDVSGAGGTSWVGVETLRARATRSLGELFWEWGIPTAASVAQLSDLGLGIIATGGVKTGLDVARALALGATAGGMARAFLMAWNEGGDQAVAHTVERVVHEIRVAHLLSGSRTPAELRSKPLVLGQDLERWVPASSSLRSR